MAIRVNGVEDAQRLIAQLKEQLPSAARAAMAELIPKVRDGIKDQASEDMHRPVRFSLGAIMSQLDDRGFGAGRVFVADRFSSGGADETHYLGVQTLGGTRERRKASEISLQLSGIMPEGMVWVPDKSVALDANGNVPGRAIQAMVAEFRSHGNARVHGRNFYMRGGVRRRAIGIFTRIGDDWYPFLWFVSPRRYAMLFDFYGRADREVAYSFGEIYDKQIRLLLERAGG